MHHIRLVLCVAVGDVQFVLTIDLIMCTDLFCCLDKKYYYIDLILVSILCVTQCGMLSA